LIDARIEPPRALIGLWQVDLDEIDAALSLPPPPTKTRARKPRPSSGEPPASLHPVADEVGARSNPCPTGGSPDDPLIVDAEFEVIEPALAEPLSAAEVLQEELDLQALAEKLRLLKARRWGS
jgi:hypothetical protein